MATQLKACDNHVNRHKARRYINEMDIHPLYPKMNLSKRMQQSKECSYLLVWRRRKASDQRNIRLFSVLVQKSRYQMALSSYNNYIL